MLIWYWKKIFSSGKLQYNIVFKLVSKAHSCTYCLKTEFILVIKPQTTRAMQINLLKHTTFRIFNTKLYAICSPWSAVNI